MDQSEYYSFNTLNSYTFQNANDMQNHIKNLHNLINNLKINNSNNQTIIINKLIQEMNNYNKNN